MSPHKHPPLPPHTPGNGTAKIKCFFLCPIDFSFDPGLLWKVTCYNWSHWEQTSFTQAHVLFLLHRARWSEHAAVVKQANVASLTFGDLTCFNLEAQRVSRGREMILTWRRLQLGNRPSSWLVLWSFMEQIRLPFSPSDWCSRTVINLWFYKCFMIVCNSLLFLLLLETSCFFFQRVSSLSVSSITVHIIL